VHFAHNFTLNHPAKYPFTRITTAIASITLDTLHKVWDELDYLSTSAVWLAEHISSLCEVYTKLWEFFCRLLKVWSSKYAAFVFLYHFESVKFFCVHPVQCTYFLYVPWFILVARYLRASLAVTNIHVGGQPAEIRGGGGEAIAHKASCSPLALSIIPSPSYCDVIKLADILRQENWTFSSDNNCGNMEVILSWFCFQVAL
jgi:hypothetical protein